MDKDQRLSQILAIWMREFDELVDGDVSIQVEEKKVIYYWNIYMKSDNFTPLFDQVYSFLMHQKSCSHFYERIF